MRQEFREGGLVVSAELLEKAPDLNLFGSWMKICLLEFLPLLIGRAQRKSKRIDHSSFACVVRTDKRCKTFLKPYNHFRGTSANAAKILDL
jgi:hypothetical protein